MKIKIFVLSILIVVISIVIEKYISNQYQIPAMRMREGLIVKKLQKMALVGGDSFFLSRSSMSGNRLNLAHWYGNQEIRHINDKAILKTRYKISLSKDSDIFVFWNHSGSSVDGIRLENNEKLTLRKQNNDMVTTKLLSRIGLLPEKIVLELEQVGKDIQIELNEKKYLVPNEYLGGTWGIRADETKVEVEEIKTIYADSSNYFQTFGTEFNLRIFIIALLSMSLICLWCCQNFCVNSVSGPGKALFQVIG